MCLRWSCSCRVQGSVPNRRRRRETAPLPWPRRGPTPSERSFSVYTARAEPVPTSWEPIVALRCMRAVRLRKAVSRFSAVVIATVLALPVSAVAKQGAMFSPQLLRPQSGSRTRLELYVLPVYRGEQCIASSPCSPPVSGRELVPAPPVGSVPVVIFRSFGGATVMRFVGTPLDRDLRSVVWVTLPRASVAERWVISVRADGRVYPDVTDSPVTTVSDESAPSMATLPPPTGARVDSNPPPWPLLAGIVLLVLAGGVLVVGRTKRRGWRLTRRA
jgi:hypothetical protein